MNVDRYLVKSYAPGYRCWEFACEAWKELTGADLAALGPAEITTLEPKVTKLEAPEDPCLVLMLRKRCEPHVGVYTKGRVLHMNQRGAEYRTLDSVTASFPEVRFYK